MQIKRGQIYTADLNPIVGSEQGGIRPVVIIQNNVGNQYSSTVIVAAITSKTKKDLPVHVKLNDCGLPKTSYALLEQIRTIDKSRLIEYCGEVSDKKMNEIIEALRVSIDI